MIRLTLIMATLAMSGAAAFAQSDRCRVMDPTGTPLNIRETPNGRVTGTIANGALVNRAEQVNDSRGRAWVFVHSRETGRPIGWVFREFVSCF